MIPFLASIINQLLSGGQNLKKPHINYFKRFYNDTALGGNTHALICYDAFFGADHVLLRTIIPSVEVTRYTIESIERMAISEAEKKTISKDNARKLLHSTV